MKNVHQKRLILEQVDRKLKPFLEANSSQIPVTGWINTIRLALGMSMRQLAERLNRKAQTIQAYEKNEASGSITLQSLKEVAEALKMKFVYAIIPKEGTLDDYVDKRAEDVARDIVNSTDMTMKLEDQGITPDQVLRALEQKKNELKTEMPKFLWD